jgi:hypothetical protein
MTVDAAGTAGVRRLAIAAMLAGLDADDERLRLLLAGLPEATLIQIVGDMAELADIVWSTRVEHRAAVRCSFATYAMELAGRLARSPAGPGSRIPGALRNPGVPHACPRLPAFRSLPRGNPYGERQRRSEGHRIRVLLHFQWPTGVLRNGSSLRREIARRLHRPSGERWTGAR